MRRSQTSSPAIQGRGISLADWEATAPLDELEITSVGIVREACNVRPLPEKVRSFPGHRWRLFFETRISTVCQCRSRSQSADDPLWISYTRFQEGAASFPASIRPRYLSATFRAGQVSCCIWSAIFETDLCRSHHDINCSAIS